MATIDKTKLSQAVTDKYSIANEAFKLTEVKNAELDSIGEPKDELHAIVGDDKQPDLFIPQLKLQRWSNEVNFSVRLVDTETGTEKISTATDKIVYEKGDKKVEFYDYVEDEGGYKLVWYLNKKPLTNKVEFTIQSKGLDFFYQPALTAEEIAEGASRPENIVGSYAVYHSTKGGMNDINGKEYKSGKAFHIFRPHIIDANGAETWGILKIENGIYSVEIPQSFLDTASFPIRSNDTFGYTDGGASTGLIASVGKGPKINVGEAGDVTSIHVDFVRFGDAAANGALYEDTNVDLSATLVVQGTAVTITAGGYHQFNVSSTAFSSGVHYPWTQSANNNIRLSFDAGSAGDGGLSATGGPTTFSSPATITADANQYSIYATYTPSGGAVTHNLSLLGVGT